MYEMLRQGRCRWTRGIAQAVVVILFSFSTFAQKPQIIHKPAAKAEAPSPSITPPSTHQLTVDDLGAFFDGLIPPQLARQNIAGAVVAVVKDGKVLFASGYGYSDVEKRKPVSPSDTLFRPGSISKLFTWTSVMQLVQQGKLDLDRDVNDYLDFKIPPRYGKPITLRNIMTHTAGFEEAVKDLFVPSDKDLVPLDQYVKAHLPARIYPPGTIPAYSNYATTLAGYIVQRVSGKPFYQYAQDNIFGPLDMTHTTFVQPLPADLQPLMSDGYSVATAPAKSYEFVQAYPAGSVATSALDMCNFMIAHLQNGRFGNVEILNPETAKLMHTAQWGFDPRLNKMALGFYEESTNGQHIISHAGDTAWFHSHLALLLDQNVGIFISVNSAGNGAPGVDIFHQFMDRYFPYTPAPPQQLADKQADANRVAGYYMSSRRSETSFLKALNAFGQTHVVPQPDGTITVDLLKDPDGLPKKYQEISPLLYREVNGELHVGFKPGPSGSLVMAIDWPFMVFQRPSLAGNQHLNEAILIYSLGLMALTLVLWPIAALARRHYGHPLVLTQKQNRMRVAVRMVCLLDLLVVLGWVLLFAGSEGPGALNDSKDGWIIFLMVLGVVAAICTLIALVNAVRNWGEKQIWVWTRIYDVAIALACIGFTWFIWYWNFINFNLKY